MTPQHLIAQVRTAERTALPSLKYNTIPRLIIWTVGLDLVSTPSVAQSGLTRGQALRDPSTSRSFLFL
jgi:hypothetical protein